MSGKRTLVLMSLMLAALMVIPTSLAQTQPEEVATADVTTEMTELNLETDSENGWVNLTLGSSKMYLRYGTGANPGGIELMTVQQRHMGIADISDENGDHVKRTGIPVEMIFYQKLNGIAEYIDANDDGLFNVHSDGMSGSFSELKDSATGHEAIDKYISFGEVSWEIAVSGKNCVRKECQIIITLSATNLSYGGINTTDVLEELSFVFRLSTVEVEVQYDKVPHYDVRAHRQGDDWGIDSSVEMNPLRVNHTAIRAVWKYDQIITGWDVATDENGSDRNDTRLMQFIDAGFASHMREKVAQWAHKQFQKLPSPKAMTGEYTPMQGKTHDERGMPLRCGLEYIQSQSGNSGSMKQQMKEYRDAKCVGLGEELNTGRVANASAVRSGALQFEDQGKRVGSLRWISNATIDGEETEVIFQVHGHRPVLPNDVDNLPDGYYRGVRISGGYNLDVGENIVHDPEYETDLVDVEAMSYDVTLISGGPPIVKLVLAALAFAVITILVVVLTVRLKSPKGLPEAAIPDAQHWGGSTTWQNPVSPDEGKANG
jgi:hypothetical protein